MDVELLREMARHQAWADEEHWKVLSGAAGLLDDPEIRKRLNHMAMTFELLQALARGEAPDAAAKKDLASMEEIRTAMARSHARFVETLDAVDLEKMIKLPRGPKGPFEAPAGVLLLQALTHSQYHRGQNASRMRELGVAPPMTDFVFWYALGRPSSGE